MMQNKCIKQVCETNTGDKQKRCKTRVVGYKATEIAFPNPFQCEQDNKFAQNLMVYVDVPLRNEGFF